MTIATTTDGVARTARFVAFPDAAPVLMESAVVRDVADLHDADFDLVLADELADAYTAADVAHALARLLGETPAALTTHTFRDRAARLAA